MGFLGVRVVIELVFLLPHSASKCAFALETSLDSGSVVREVSRPGILCIVSHFKFV